MSRRKQRNSGAVTSHLSPQISNVTNSQLPIAAIQVQAVIIVASGGTTVEEELKANMFVYLCAGLIK